MLYLAKFVHIFNKVVNRADITLPIASKGQTRHVFPFIKRKTKKPNQIVSLLAATACVMQLKIQVSILKLFDYLPTCL